MTGHQRRLLFLVSCVLSYQQLYGLVLVCPNVKYLSFGRKIAIDRSTIQRKRSTSSSTSSSVSAGSGSPDNDLRREQSLLWGKYPLLSLNLNLDSLAKSGKEGAAGRAQELLQRIQALHKEGYYNAPPDTVSLNTVLNAWARSDDEDAAKMAYDLLRFTEDASSGNRIETNEITYNTLINTFANNDKPEQAESILREMQSDSRMKPSTITYNSVIKAYARRSDRLQRKRQQQKNKNKWQIQDNSGTSSSLAAAHKAEEILKEMVALARDGDFSVKPDLISFNTVLHAWSCSNQPVKAEKLLNYMFKLSKSEGNNVEPDVYSYTSVIKAWTASTARRGHAATKAKDILERLENMSQQDGKRHLKPNIVVYTSVLTALSKSGNRAQEAQDLLNTMLRRYYDGDDNMKPDVVTFSSVIDGWAREGTKEAGEKAMALLDQMKNMYQKGNYSVKPNARTYTSVISALGKSRQRWSAGQAEELLYEMEQQYLSGDKDLELSNFCFNAVLDAYARSPLIDKATYAYNLLQRMEESDYPKVNPDTISYNSVISACANSFGDIDVQKKAFQIALLCFQRIWHRRNLHPTSVTFTLFFKAVRKLIKDGKARDSMLEKTFTLCVNAGLVNFHVLKQIQSIYEDDSEKLNSLLIKAGIDEKIKLLNREVEISDLPKAWKCNSRR